jgi:hypothetical protein
MSPDGAGVSGAGCAIALPLRIACESSCRAVLPQPSSAQAIHMFAVRAETHRRAITPAIVARFIRAAQRSFQSAVVG